MKPRLFYALLLLWSYTLGQNKFEQHDDVKTFENNADETGQNPSKVTAETDDGIVQTDSTTQVDNVDIQNAKAEENIFIRPDSTEGNSQENVNHGNIENVDYSQAETEQNPTEGIIESEYNNGGHVVETNSPEGQSEIELEQNYNADNFETIDSQLESEQHFAEVLHLDDEQKSETDPAENLTPQEFEKDLDSETFENNVVYNPDEIEQNPVKAVSEYQVDIDKHDVQTNTVDEILARDGMKQNQNSENVESVGTEQHFTGVIPDYKVDSNELDVGIDPREIQGNLPEELNMDPIQTNSYKPGEFVDHEEYVGTDFVEFYGLPEIISGPNLRTTIRYSVAGPRVFVIEIFTVGADHTESIFHTEWTEMLYNPGDVKEKILRVTLPDNLVYREDRILHVSPDLHSVSLTIRAYMVDFESPSMKSLTEHSLKLLPPWSRLPKHSKTTCGSWIGMLFKNLTRNKIPKCAKIDDVVELLPFPVALTGDEFAYRKFFQNLHEPDELQNRPPQFTLATWLYLVKRCSKDMCPLLYRIKGTAFQSPLIGVLKAGYLHFQFHSEDGSGYAFLVDAQIPIHKWIHITVAIKHTVVSVYLRYGEKLQHVKTFVHSDFPPEMYHYNDTDGYWGQGGSPGFASSQGFIGPSRIYRRHALSQESIETIFTTSSKPHLGIAAHFRSCRKLKKTVRILLRKESRARKLCSSRGWLNGGKSLNCDVGVGGLASEIVHVLIETLNMNEAIASDIIRQNVYNYAFNLTKTDLIYVQDVLPLLSYSSCLGHPQSLHLLSVLYRTGLGVNMNPTISQRYLLLGSYYNHSLSQMSLAYKHYIGVDNLPKDHEVASTYYRYAAVQSNRLLVEHNEVDTHSEAVRLDKKVDLENYRGPNSNWFSWLKHQAKRGVTDAQSALGEVFYYGSRGFRRNLTKAAEFYEMGANRGDAQMLFNLGVVKLRGQGVNVNADEARDLLRKSAELGFAPAYNALGYYELNMRQNKSGAVDYFRFAAEHGDRDGLYNYGFALENGLTPGSVGDLKSAMPYYISAANKGHPGACVVAGDAFSVGQYVERDVRIAIIFYKFVADQIPEIGLHLRNGLDGYFENTWYQSLLHYLLAAEAGMEIAQYNAALLCEWDRERVSRHTQVDCAWRYYNHSAKLEWVPSLIKTGDNHWYGITAEKNITTAAQLYSQAAAKEQNPQAIYNLAYLVENNYPLDGFNWMHFHPSSVNPGNLTVAAALYRKCRDTSDEASIPCSLGLLRVTVKMAWQLELVKSEILLIPLTLFIVFLALLNYLCRLNSDHQMIELA